MNILTDRLPDTVEVGGYEIAINTDFRAGIKFELLVEKGESNVYSLLRLYYPAGYPKNDLRGALEAALMFYRCGDNTEPKQGGSDKPTSKKQAYSFSVDSETIFADFLRYYGLDLSSINLHWWAFRALLLGLPDDSGYKQRIYYRTCDLAGLPKKERERINKIRKLIEINPEGRGKLTLEERNAQMLAYATRRSKEANKVVNT